ncbi:ornithine decarboxylase antizyme-domain-containing protein [Kockovaella imperatae]|uniref:Ornithine decarboxylase antizyme n=1 Tax=Kockovaella imperatae TaxID=4999 RepID=A0A1Y1UR59_9TREE|nr:ornithine decarboxylase antizyme-domain-containing protein [Kockovaella imperatae]ORX40469.1 ornithine decarboxylase antizyme-domain-containing protein [Kockovaella imperatae]
MSRNIRQMTSSNRNLGPAGALGSASKGAPDILPSLFSTTIHHDIDNPTCPALAVARVGGTGGQIYVYSDEPVDSVSGPPRGVRDSLMSYLLSCSHPATVKQDSRIHQPVPQDHHTLPLTPPSSYTPNVNIPQASAVVNHLDRRQSLPLTPDSIPTDEPMIQSLPSPQTCPSPPPRMTTHVSIQLVNDLFPRQASQFDTCTHALEIVTPPDHITQGFILDHQLYGRSVYIHLRPPHSASDRPEDLSANFSEVLRPHDPSRMRGTSPDDDLAESQALDIRESLTALLDLASDSLDAKNLILVLDKSDRDLGGLDELLHSLMFVGGQVVRPGLLEGGWDWDSNRWVLVGIEL